MLKENTVGRVGEKLFEKLLIDNNIPYTNLVEKCLSHPFDFIVNRYNVEIKTSTIHNFNNDICFSWTKNDTENIHYLIGLVVNKSNKIKHFYLFDNKYVNTHAGYRATKITKNKPIINKKQLILLLS